MTFHENVKKNILEICSFLSSFRDRFTETRDVFDVGNITALASIRSTFVYPGIIKAIWQSSTGAPSSEFSQICSDTLLGAGFTLCTCPVV